jgi:5-dehydro-2-deoxygluconokinase
MKIARATSARSSSISTIARALGLTGLGLGENRFVDSAEVTATLLALLPDCDVIVGTEEEIHIAGGSTDTPTALARLREVSRAIIVLKRGAAGCVAYPGEIDGGIEAPGFPVEVYNVLGAGDGFMSGFCAAISAEIRGRSCRCAVPAGRSSSRAMAARRPRPLDRAQHFLDHGSAQRSLRLDAGLEHIHWATNRRGDWPEICALAFDHRPQLARLAKRHGQPPARIAEFKKLIYRAAKQAAGDDPAFGIIVDDIYGREVLELAAGAHWVARPIEQAGSTPLVFEGGADVGLTLREWPVTQAVKCLVHWQPGDPPSIAEAQARQLQVLGAACRETGHELLLELIANAKNPGDARATVEMIRRVYALGLKPDWWKLAPPEDPAGWRLIEDAIAEADRLCGRRPAGFRCAAGRAGALLRATARARICRASPSAQHLGSRRRNGSPAR